MSTESVMLSSHLILCHPVLLLPSILPSIRVFSNESALRIRWPKYWSFSNNPSNENSGLISFRVDCYDLLAVQGTLKSLLQYSVIKMNNWDIQWRGWIGKKRGLVKEARHHLCDSICVKLKRRQNESDRDRVRRCLRAEMYWLERRLKETSRIGNVSCLDLSG